jgi:hypothetical protein
MITQYEAVAEIEAMKAKPRRRLQQATTTGESAGFGWGASENAIRAEMERRLARRASAKPVASQRAESA